MIRINRLKPDLISSIAAVVCAIHCVVLPVFFSSLPLLGIEIIENIWLEFGTILVSFLVGGTAIYNGYFYAHKCKWIVLLFLFGIILMASGNFVSSETSDYSLKILGALFLLVCHTSNWIKSYQKNCTLS